LAKRKQTDSNCSSHIQINIRYGLNPLGKLGVNQAFRDSSSSAAILSSVLSGKGRPPQRSKRAFRTEANGSVQVDQRVRLQNIRQTADSSVDASQQPEKHQSFLLHSRKLVGLKSIHNASIKQHSVKPSANLHRHSQSLRLLKGISRHALRATETMKKAKGNENRQDHGKLNIQTDSNIHLRNAGSLERLARDKVVE